MTPRVYDLVHRTTYEYDRPVTESYGVTALTRQHRIYFCIGLFLSRLESYTQLVQLSR